MISHALYIAQMVFGICLLFMAFVVWSMVRRMSTVVLCITGFLLYLYLSVNQLSHYEIIGSTIPVVGSLSNFNNILLILLIGVFLAAFIVLIREERKSG
jgi:hypothetical protein